MIENQVVEATRADHVEILTMNRPDALNAFNNEMVRELTSHARRIRHDDGVHCVVLTGAPRPDRQACFSAGVDLLEAAAGESNIFNQGKKLAGLIDEMLTPWIAVIDGICTTGALELALACDLRLIAPTARLSAGHLAQQGSGLGGWGLSTRLSRLVGVAEATDLILTGREIDGAEALRIGLAQRLVTSRDLQAEARRVAETIAGMDREGVRLTLAHLSRVPDLPKEEALHFADQLRQWMPGGGGTGVAGHDLDRDA